MSERSQPIAGLVEGRSCDGCSLCCHLLTIPELNKPALVWCTHCEIGKGCGIYASRPQVCADYYCEYRHNADLGEEWRPTKSMMVVTFDQALNRINIGVDPSRMGAWREAPYFQQIKTWALSILRQRGHLIVWEGPEAVAVLPDREVRLGELGNRVVVVMGRTTPREEYDVLALAPDDPLLQHYKPTV
ncbi:MAG: hypothetical protein WAU68_13040 [Vitreimonas sp.]